MSHGWGYQLQNYQKPFGLDRIRNSSQMLWVIDYSKDGTDKKKFTKKEIDSLKKNGRKVLSYLSIGEAEKYRWYYPKMNKDLILKENKNWEGNYLVKYWEEEWKLIIDQYVDTIAAQGFSGLYLDIVDAFERIDNKLKNKKRAALEMQKLIVRISKRMKKLNPGSLIFIQNGYHIVKHLEDVDLFIDSIDGIAVEGMLFAYDSSLDMNYQLNELRECLPFYEDKIRLSVEYVKNDEEQGYLDMAEDLNLIPQRATRELNGVLFLN